MALATTRVEAAGLGVRFMFDTHGSVVTPARSRLALRRTEAWGLRDVDLEIESGQGVALIGATGSGKTSLLRAIAGVLPADEGTLRVEGRVASMLSIDAGLLPTLTGRENALLLAVLGGSGRAEAKSRLELVKERSGLGEFFERPASAYSQGMRARLGFTATTAFAPEVILLDEVHEALDHSFRTTMEETVRETLARGGVAIAAGHDHEILSRICGRGLLMERGRIVARGPFEQVRATYLDRDLPDSLGDRIGPVPRVPGSSS